MKFSKELQLYHFSKYCPFKNDTKSRQKLPCFLDLSFHSFSFINKLFKSKCKQTVLTGISSSKYLILQCFVKYIKRNSKQVIIYHCTNVF